MKKWLFLSIVISVIVIFNGCGPDPEPAPVPGEIKDEDKGLAARWADVTLQTVRVSYPGSPTFTSRNLGYIGVTMYESVVPGSPTNKSLIGQLNGLTSLPQPESGKDYHWELALNAGQATILRLLYAHSTNLELIDNLETATLAQYSSVAPEIKERSIAFGQAVAQAVFEWSKTDGGHEGYKFNFDPSYEVPSGPSYWTAPLVGQSSSPYPLHPYWGQNRTFVAANGALPVPEIANYSGVVGSDYYEYFNDVYEKQKSLTDEDRRIAAWWADDPTQTASPPGHSFNLATIAVTTAQADIFTAAETYAKVGMAVADAFICCWKAKYVYHSERPTPFIQSFIDEKYKPFWPEPPFPAFPSGHATQSAAAAIEMISVYGDNFAVVDNTYSKRSPDFQDIPYQTRTFSNIWLTAEECAYSRFLGAIHTPQDNTQGQLQGQRIGKNVSDLNWKN